MQAEKDITFGKFRLDFTNECLWHDSSSISLRPKAFAVLKLLIENPGQLVSKQKVLDTVWPNTFVGDAVLKDNIRQLREALNDDAAAPTYIETAHRRGYRFIAHAPTPVAAPPASEQSVSSTLPSLADRLLGRDGELEKMQSWLQHTLAGQRQTVFVTGEPGIGKTSLINAFLQNATRIPGLLVARGQCLEQYGSGEAYLPVLDGFSRLCRSAAGNRVIDILRQHAPAWLAQISSVLPHSERELLQKQATGSTRERMLRDMAEAVEALTNEAPLLLVLEDLHWSDYSTLDLMSYLARGRDPARLLIIGTYRPVDVILGDHPVKGVKRELQAHGLCHELPLEYLSEKAIDEYLTRRFPVQQFSPRLKRKIYQRTEGNPLFMVNLVEYLIDQKIIVEEQGTWSLRVEVSDVEHEIPSNIRELIEKQIERLNPDERAVLEAATVAGMECSAVAIAAGLDRPVDWVEQQCDELARRHHLLSPGWLVELPDGTLSPRYRFVHVLYRDVPYRMMAPMRRSQIHQRIAERGVAIYGVQSSEIAAELAMHFEQSRDWPRAVQYLVQAAENAARKSAHHEAADLAQRGLSVLKLLPESAERDQHEVALRMILILSLMAVKGFAWAGVEQVYADGRDLFRSTKPSPERFNWLYLLGLLHMFRGKIRPALAIADQVVEIAEGLKDSRLIMEAYRAKGSTLLEMGRCSEALEYLDRASNLYSVNPHYQTLISGRDCKVLSECSAGKALWALGFPDAAMRRMQTGLEFARQLSHPQSLTYATHFTAQLHQLRGEPQLAQERAKEGIRVAEEYYLELWVGFGKIALGWAEAELGDVQQGIEHMQQGLTSNRATETKIFYPTFLGSLADQLNNAHRTAEGLAVIAQALTCAEQTEEGYALAELHRIKGELLLNSSDLLRGGKLAGDSSTISTLSEARACFNDALTIAKEQGLRSWQLRAALSMYRLDLMLGNPDATQLAEIYSSFTEGFETADLEQAAAILSQQQDSDLRRNSDSVSRVCLPNVGLPDKIVAASAIRQ
jgi:DNA-binding winged helix-turn-helix (wHTH) protein/tetratricopeptide (TPR) repeat protein